MKKSLFFLNAENKKFYLIITFLKKNPLYFLYIILVLFTFFFSLTENKWLILLAAIMFQQNLMMMRISAKGKKILHFVLLLLMSLAVYIERIDIMLPIVLANIVFNITDLKGLFLKLMKKTDGQKKILYKSPLMLKFFFRKKKSEFSEYIVEWVILLFLWWNFGIEFASFFVVLFSTAKLQLSLEKSQLDYKRTYLKNVFLNTQKVSLWKKIYLSNEFREIKLDIFGLFIAALFVSLTKEGINGMLNFVIVALIIGILNIKDSKLFFQTIEKRMIYKPNFIFTLIQVYVLIGITSINFFSAKNGISFFLVFLIDLLILIVVYIVPFEKLFIPKNEQNDFLKIEDEWEFIRN
ncbi:MAG: hypothetical protein ACRCUP_07310 [Mycoplasmatales bacterium]